ncbi:hypothetical protein Amet_0624 [Alkaliphilus metalliredigens QYMF]|uniref:KWG Leptospira repeat protein n=1 Tax=Alkaliphilus metalliredigens (strain QYMF) TaxID=293826 RepID=A6TKY2_ALKMQ|nr:hypothetical protein [Alkaliphilus metalliredigens]ABR46850.1 hypothetical protein Amet_0624 [Alkaliphilus metalliredigens QYMF]
MRTFPVGNASFSDDGFVLVQEENGLGIIDLQEKYVIPPTIEGILLDGYVVDVYY